MPIRETATGVWTYLTSAVTSFVSFLPALIGAAIVLLIGWFISGLLARLVDRGLELIGLERAMDAAGVNSFVKRTGTRWDTSRVIGELVKWFVFLIFIQSAANILGMPQVTTVINSIVLYIPNIIVAGVILIAGVLLARLVSNLVRGAMSEMENPEFLARLTRVAIMAFAVIAAISQLGIATVVINALVNGLIGAMALAFGLAFGLGGTKVAEKMTENWYDTSSAYRSRRRTRTREIPPSDEGETRRKAS